MLDLRCSCDGCSKHIDDGDYTYCRGCFVGMEEKIEKLEKEIEALEMERVKVDPTHES